MANNYLNLIKPSSKWKLVASFTQSLPNPNLFHHFSSTPHDRSYLKKEQALLSLFKKSYTKTDVQQLHAHVIRSGFTQNLFVVGKVIVFCAVSDECLMDYAVSVFEKIANPDGFLWNTMIRGFGRINKVDKVFCYYKMMLENGHIVDNFTLSFLLKASGQSGSVLLGKQVHCSVVKLGFECHVFVRNTLVHMYGMLKDVFVARQLFDEMPEPDLVGWNTIIDCHVCCGKHKEALDLFSRMQDAGIRPDDATLVVALSACAALGALELGRWIHSIVDERFLMKDVSIVNSLIHMYTRCGEIQEARRIFDKMNDRNIVTWNTMILGLATHGHVQDALSLFSSMINKKRVPPDDVTFLGVLTACSHGGMIEEGRQYFNRMTNEHNIEPTIKHYGCMVDMLSRGGLVIEAYNLIKNMPMKCNAIVLRTLLAGCHMHGNIELAENVRRHLLEVDPDHSSDYVLLANTYASLEDWNQVSRIRRSMAANKVKKPSPGNSFIGVP
ncbi:putative tetratricopeptide-like helical domain superfamily [Helianthus annuus]|uniref:Tetratricopeptide-like helical domain superfamily n=1 Tax=Helianthus annuus TaxID=4232 RepID=A0A9K3NNU1_HELAN|nr:pentatricopeptide repeat-containing protein At4g21065-like [Helianthus annuus]KAF5807229.1 putative tetratricopeptide-like helical domain superfamily [Helianthus annuus]KAJ0585746.1 putative tetratricopeptide-like helical domain superfamily [Helianthus annuus]KAJ0920370.1 putative tetratricopeptide-like helical domain superfamily [Helianthus annuus]KAJ0923991.1 putative tetratricopeptide-like helical domain superfamily [Helianthus annuus]